MQKEFYSNGKLLLSGEYVILDGALGLAIPTKFGQSLRIEKTIENNILAWESFDEKNQKWFQADFDLTRFDIISTSDATSANTLKQLLKEAQRHNHSFLKNDTGIKVTTFLSFPREWGLGTSSTLINNIAQWAEVNAYTLLWNAFGGSGYDIACAQKNTPLLYQLENGKVNVQSVSFEPSFRDSIFFVYLNQKQSSKTAIEAYRSQEFDKEQLISRISTLTKDIVASSSLENFETLLEEHERLMSQVLDMPTVKQRLFKDYPRAIKSLGAWGGDFVMATGSEEYKDYFNSKGYRTILSYDQMVL